MRCKGSSSEEAPLSVESLSVESLSDESLSSESYSVKSSESPCTTLQLQISRTSYIFKMLDNQMFMLNKLFKIKQILPPHCGVLSLSSESFSVKSSESPCTTL